MCRIFLVRMHGCFLISPMKTRDALKIDTHKYFFSNRVTAPKPIFEKRESIRVVPSSGRTPPPKILVIRFHALGDIVITLPYLQALHSIWPSSQLHFLTREEFSDLPRRMKMIGTVYTIGGGRDRAAQFGNAVRLVPRLRKEHYNIVIDFQRNTLSRMLRQIMRPKSLLSLTGSSLQNPFLLNTLWRHSNSPLQ